MEKGEITHLDLVQKYKESAYGKTMESEVKEILKNMKMNKVSGTNIKDASMDKFATGFLKQVRSNMRSHGLPLKAYLQGNVLLYI